MVVCYCYHSRMFRYDFTVSHIRNVRVIWRSHNSQQLVSTVSRQKCHRRCCAGTEIGESFNRRTEMAMSAKLNPLENWFWRPCAMCVCEWRHRTTTLLSEKPFSQFERHSDFPFSFWQMQMWNVFLTFFPVLYRNPHRNWQSVNYTVKWQRTVSQRC